MDARHILGAVRRLELHELALHEFGADAENRVLRDHPHRGLEVERAEEDAEFAERGPDDSAHHDEPDREHREQDHEAGARLEFLAGKEHRHHRREAGRRDRALAAVHEEKRAAAERAGADRGRGPREAAAEAENRERAEPDETDAHHR